MLARLLRGSNALARYVAVRLGRKDSSEYAFLWAKGILVEQSYLLDKRFRPRRMSAGTRTRWP